jgi:hypothetical protein
VQAWLGGRTPDGDAQPAATAGRDAPASGRQTGKKPEGERPSPAPLPAQALTRAQKTPESADSTQAMVAAGRTEGLTRALQWRARHEENPMATRPLAFGVRLRDPQRGRTVRLLQDPRSPQRYRIEETLKNGTARRSDHGSLGGALRNLASLWRNRLH